MNKKISPVIKEAVNITVIILCAAVYAAALHIFVFNSNFAPMGIDGISTMVQFLTGFNAGFTGLIINIPLLVLGWFLLNRKYVYYTVIFTVAENLFLILYADINLYQYTSAAGDYLLAALFGAIIRGALCGFTILLGGSTGGLDIVASLIQRKFEHISFDKMLLIFNLIIISFSFFIYGRNLNPIFLSVVSAYAYSKIIESVMKGPKSALEFKIITECADELKDEILFVLKHGVTIVDAKGGFTDGEKQLLLCVVNNRDIGAFKKIIKKHDKTFAYICDTRDVIGNFRRKQNEIPK